MQVKSLCRSFVQVFVQCFPFMNDSFIVYCERCPAIFVKSDNVQGNGNFRPHVSTSNWWRWKLPDLLSRLVYNKKTVTLWSVGGLNRVVMDIVTDCLNVPY